MGAIRFLPGGEVRTIWADDLPLRQLFPGAMPERASRIEVIREGSQCGKFHVDFSLLANATGNEDYRVCLAQAFDSYMAANRAEVEWLRVNYVEAPCRPS